MRSVFTRATLCGFSLLLAVGANFQALAEEGEPVVVGAIVVEGLVTATEGATTSDSEYSHRLSRVTGGIDKRGMHALRTTAPDQGR